MSTPLTTGGGTADAGNASAVPIRSWRRSRQVKVVVTPAAAGRTYWPLAVVMLTSTSRSLSTARSARGALAWRTVPVTARTAAESAAAGAALTPRRGAPPTAAGGAAGIESATSKANCVEPLDASGTSAICTSAPTVAAVGRHCAPSSSHTALPNGAPAAANNSASGLRSAPVPGDAGGSLSCAPPSALATAQTPEAPIDARWWPAHRPRVVARPVRDRRRVPGRTANQSPLGPSTYRRNSLLPRRLLLQFLRRAPSYCAISFLSSR